jgi:large subunit ribosomal protein L3
LAFLGYKAGMCHVIVADNRPKSQTKGEHISMPATIIECPPIKVIAINFYHVDTAASHLISTVFSDESMKDKDLNRTIPLPKKIAKKVEDVKDWDDIRVLICTQPKNTGIGTKKPIIAEVALGGSKEEKMKYASEKLGKEVAINDVFKDGSYVDIHGISKGKGFQGPVKRHGVMLRHHKSEKARRANVRGPWTGPKMWTVPHSGRMGHHQRIEYNKLVLKVGKTGSEIQAPGGLPQYGQVKSSYLLIYGSLPGPRKGIVTLTHPIRLTTIPFKEAPHIKSVVL